MRIRPLLPTLLLLSTAAVFPAAAGQYDMCLTAADSVNCIIEQAEFARQRNDEINASIANVARARAFEQARNAEIAASIAAVNAVRTRQLEVEQNALATRVLAAANAERNRRFAAQQNKLASESVERVAALRTWELAMSTTHCKSPRSHTPRCAAERMRKFAKRQNALATASIERVKTERARQFAAARNAEIETSIAAVARNRASILTINTTHCTGIEITPRCEAERNRELTLALTHCKSDADTSPRCAVERNREFAAARNVEINASIAAVERARAASPDYSWIETSTVCEANNCRPEEGDYAALTSHCVDNPESPRCAAERIREFAAARNAEINASIAAVKRARSSVSNDDQPAAMNAAEYAALASHCVRRPESPRCAAERTREFAAARNAEINASIAAVARNRAATLAINITHCNGPQVTPRCAAERARELKLALTHCKTAAHMSPRCEEERNRQRVLAQCKLAGYSSSGCNFEPARQAAALSAAEYAALTSHCVRSPQSPRCDAERIREFAAARNAEIERSLAAVARNRATSGNYGRIETSGICKPYKCSLEPAEYAMLTSHCVRRPESPRCAAERIREFAAARNAEIERSLAAVARQRALQRKQAADAMHQGRINALNAALSAYGSIDSPLETGAIGGPELPMEPGPTPAQDLKLQHNSANESCRPAGQPFAPLPFTKGISVDESMVPELDRLAAIASVCPGVRIEVHGYADGKGSPSTNRANAQAGAQVVTDYLIAAGIAPNRIAAIGRGGMHSVLPYSKGDRQSRVEFVVRDPGMDVVARRVMWDLAELLDPTYVPAVAGLSP